MIAQYYPQFLSGITDGNAIARAQTVQLNQIAQNTLRNADAAVEMRDILKRVTQGGDKIRVA